MLNAFGTLVICDGNLNSALLASLKTFALSDGSKDMTCAISRAPDLGSSNNWRRRTQVSGKVKLLFAYFISGAKDISTLYF